MFIDPFPEDISLVRFAFALGIFTLSIFFTSSSVLGHNSNATMYFIFSRATCTFNDAGVLLKVS